MRSKLVVGEGIPPIECPQIVPHNSVAKSVPQKPLFRDQHCCIPDGGFARHVDVGCGVLGEFAMLKLKSSENGTNNRQGWGTEQLQQIDSVKEKLPSMGESGSPYQTEIREARCA